jgi:hypothetical protein
VVITAYPPCCANSPPVFVSSPTNQTLAELTMLTVTNAANPGSPPNPVTYQLLNSPTGATIDTNGVITWRPTEAQGPGTNTITTVAVNSGVPSLSATNSFTVVVQEINLPPVLPTQTNRTLIGLQTLVVTNTATDPDIPINTLTYVLQTGPPNAAVDTNGVITWSPIVAQVPSTNLFTTVVTDFNPWAVNSQHLSATNSFIVVVNAVHNGPVLPVQTNQIIAELTTLLVTNTASNNDIPSLALSYALVNPPAGASIDTNGVISWTPTEAQGPATNLITTIVSDSGTPALSATNGFMVVVQEINLPPVLPLQTNRSLSGLQTLLITNTATDSDIPTNALTYVLETGPTNALIDTNGVIIWTPVVAQVPSTNLFTTVVTDFNPWAVNAQHLSATNSFTVVVNAVHNGPILPSQTDQTVAEMTLLLVTNTANDTDLPPLMLTYSLVNSPAGISIDTNGVISWTPTEAQGPGTNVITTIVTDSGTPAVSATNSFTVVVQEINLPPVLPLQTNRTLIDLQTLTVINTATDPDIPANTLTYVLQTGPTNAVIDTNGIITWTPVAGQVPSTNLFTTVVTDFNPWAVNEQSLSATNSFLVSVNPSQVPPPPILIDSITVTDGVATITWSTAIGYTYRLQYKDNVADAAWMDLPADVPGAGPSATLTNVVTGSTQRFYRVRLVR